MIEASLMRAGRIAFHPLDNGRTTVLASAGLSAFLVSIGRYAVVADF